MQEGKGASRLQHEKQGRVHQQEVSLRQGLISRETSEMILLMRPGYESILRKNFKKNGE